MIYRVLMLLICLAIFNFGGVKASNYVDELTRFNRGFVTQVLSNAFGSEAEEPIASRLVSIQGFQKFCEDFADEPNINDLDALGSAPIHYLAMTKVPSQEDYKSIKEMCEILISMGANINLPNKYGVYPLNLAVNYGNYAAVESFLASGKLRKDLNIFKIIFSEDLDFETQFFRHEILYGKIRICNALQMAWLPSVSRDDFDMLQTEFRKINFQRKLNENSMYFLGASSRLIKGYMRNINNILSKYIGATSNGAREATIAFLKKFKL